MEPLATGIVDLIRSVLSGRDLWATLTVTGSLLTLTLLLGIAGRIALWLEMVHSRNLS